MKASLRQSGFRRDRNAAAYGTGLPPVARPPRSGQLREAATRLPQTARLPQRPLPAFSGSTASRRAARRSSDEHSSPLSPVGGGLVSGARELVPQGLAPPVQNLPLRDTHPPLFLRRLGPARATGSGSDESRVLARPHPVLWLRSQCDCVAALRSLPAGNSHQLLGRKELALPSLGVRESLGGPCIRRGAGRHPLASPCLLRSGIPVARLSPPASSTLCARPADVARLTTASSRKRPFGV